MWLTLPLLAALVAPAQPPAKPPAAGGLTLTNVRSTFGPFGGTRPPAPMLPGDLLFLAFDIGGVNPTTEGKATYTMKMEVKDAAGKKWFGEEPFTKTDDIPLGGTSLPGIAFTFIGYDQPPGNYILTLAVTDEAKRSTGFSHPFIVAPKGLGVVAVGTSLDERGQMPVPNGGFVGQTLTCHFYVVGFGRDDPATRKGAAKLDPKAAKPGPQPNAEVEMVVTENGKPVLAKPAVTTVEGGLKDDEPAFNLRYAVPLTRPGRFVVTMTVTDRVTGKKASFSLPLTAVPPPG